MRRRVHIPLFIIAVISAMTVKIAVHESRRLTETTIRCQVNYHRPEGVMILDPVQQIEVRVQGERSEIATLAPFNVQVDVNLEEGELGPIDITDERLVVRGPAEFEVVSKEPNIFTITVEEIETLAVKVVVEPTGEPAAGAVPGAAVVTPSTVLVEGPKSRINDQTVIRVDVNLDGRAFAIDESFTVLSPDPLVKVIDPRRVRVRIPMTIPGLETPPAGLEAPSESQIEELSENSREES